jgi:short-subunit dehydrogenase
VNVDGIVHGLHAVLPPMVKRGSGSVLVTASQSGLAPHAGDPLYAATKHFAIGLARSLALQTKKTGVRVNVVCPGATDTAIIPEVLREGERGIVFQTPERVAQTAINILLDRTETGEAWIVPPTAPPQLWEFHDVPAEYRKIATEQVPI